MRNGGFTKEHKRNVIRNFVRQNNREGKNTKKKNEGEKTMVMIIALYN